MAESVLLEDEFRAGKTRRANARIPKSRRSRFIMTASEQIESPPTSWEKPAGGCEASYSDKHSGRRRVAVAAKKYSVARGLSTAKKCVWIVKFGLNAVQHMSEMPNSMIRLCQKRSPDVLRWNGYKILRRRIGFQLCSSSRARLSVAGARISISPRSQNPLDGCP